MKARPGRPRLSTTDSLPRRIYPATWSVAFVLVSTVGLLAAIVTLDGRALASLVLSVFLATLASLAVWSTVTPMPRYLPVVAGAWATILILVADGLVTMLGPWSLVGLISLCLASPVLLRSVHSVRAGAVADARPRRRRAAAPTPKPVVADLQFEDPHAARLLDPECPTSKRPDISGLSRADLDEIWRTSGLWLARGLNAKETAHLARLRESCLDEMERRDPVAFVPWVAAEHPWIEEPPDASRSDDRDPPPEGAGAT